MSQKIKENNKPPSSFIQNIREVKNMTYLQKIFYFHLEFAFNFRKYKYANKYNTSEIS